MKSPMKLLAGLLLLLATALPATAQNTTGMSISSCGTVPVAFKPSSSTQTFPGPFTVDTNGNIVTGDPDAGTNIGTPTVAAADGTRLPRQPKFKGTTTIRYDTDIGSMKGYIQGAALYQTGATQDLNVENNAL